MTKPFTRTFRVRWSEINAIGQVGLAEYFRFVIETAWDWGSTRGLSIAESEELGLVWVIRETEINIYLPLYPNAVFDFTIWLIKWRRVRGTRCFELRFKEGCEIVAQGAQQIVALDSNSLRPTPPPENLMDNFRIENPRIIQQRKFPKFEVKQEAAFVMRRDVEWRDLDSLEHVNNAVYAAYAEDAITQALASVGWSPAYFKTQFLNVINRRVHMKYLTPAVWGDTLDVVTCLMELKATGGAWQIEIQRSSDGETIIQCIIEWSLVNRISGEEQNLPESLFHALKKRVDLPEKTDSNPVRS